MIESVRMLFDPCVPELSFLETHLDTSVARKYNVAKDKLVDLFVEVHIVFYDYVCHADHPPRLTPFIPDAFLSDPETSGSTYRTPSSSKETSSGDADPNAQ